MEIEHEDYLTSRFPMYKVIGFECGDGWFDMLNRMSLEVEEYSKKFDMPVEVYQVKEKFGTLRFYCNLSSPHLLYIIDKYERISRQTCLYCGAPSVIFTRRGWIHNMCEKCKEKFDGANL